MSELLRFPLPNQPAPDAKVKLTGPWKALRDAIRNRLHLDYLDDKIKGLESENADLIARIRELEEKFKS